MNDPSLHDNFEAEPNSLVIDLGAGGGQETTAFLKRYRVIAIDNFKGFTSHLSPLKNKHQKALSVIEKDLSPNLLPQNGNAALILAAEVLEYCNPSLVIPLFRSVYQSLKPGGKFRVSFLNGSKTKQDQIVSLKKTGCWCIRDEESMIRLLKEIGFKFVVAIQHPEDPRIFFNCEKPHKD